MKPLSFLATYRQHNLFLLLATILLSGAVYYFSFLRTWGNYQTYRQTVQDINRAKNVQNEIAKYEQALAQWEQSSLQKYDREKLLELVTNFCRTHQLLIKTYPEAERVKENGFPVVTNEIEVEGAFKDMVTLVYLLEHQEKIGSIASLQFFRHKDRRKRQEVLRGRIILRNLEG